MTLPRAALDSSLSPWQFQIGELANTLTNKLEFLGINRQSISNFHMLLLQTEVTEPWPLAPAFCSEADQITVRRSSAEGWRCVNLVAAAAPCRLCLSVLPPRGASMALR